MTTLKIAQATSQIIAQRQASLTLIQTLKISGAMPYLIVGSCLLGVLVSVAMTPIPAIIPIKIKGWLTLTGIIVGSVCVAKGGYKYVTYTPPEPTPQEVRQIIAEKEEAEEEARREEIRKAKKQASHKRALRQARGEVVVSDVVATAQDTYKGLGETSKTVANITLIAFVGAILVYVWSRGDGVVDSVVKTGSTLGAGLIGAGVGSVAGPAGTVVGGVTGVTLSTLYYIFDWRVGFIIASLGGFALLGWFGGQMVLPALANPTALPKAAKMFNAVVSVGVPFFGPVIADIVTLTCQQASTISLLGTAYSVKMVAGAMCGVGSILAMMFIAPTQSLISEWYYNHNRQELLN